MLRAAAISLCLTAAALADTIEVPSDYPTIAAALKAANGGDQILISAGTYFESGLFIEDPNISIIGEVNSDGTPSVIIDGSKGSSDVLLGIGISAATGAEVQNIHFTGSSGGNALWIYHHNPTITNCLFTNNNAGVLGSAVWGSDSQAVFQSCTFTNNHLSVGSVFFFKSTFDDAGPIIRECTFEGNSGGSTVQIQYCNPLFDQCTFANNIGDNGGGLYSYSSDPTLIDCTFEGNSAEYGGGMYNYYSNSTLENCTFTGNSASALSGGMHIELSQPTLTNCLFEENECLNGFGGGICVIDGVLSLQDCAFIGNIAGSGGGVYNQPDYNDAYDAEVHGCLFENNHAVNGNYGHGGGLSHRREYLNLTNSTFRNNSATGFGGGLSEFASDGMVIRSCEFSNNTAHSGGGIDTSGIGECTVLSSNFISNQATLYGGGINSSSPGLSLTNCRLTNNVSNSLGGAVLVLYADQQPTMFVNCIMDGNTTKKGATVSIHGTLLTKFINTTIVNNTGPGLYLEGWEGLMVEVFNSILWGNSPVQISTIGGIGVDVQFSNIEGGWEGEGNIDADPQIIFDEDMVFMSPNSPCIDGASNALLPFDSSDIDADGDTSELLPVDFYGETRIQGDAVDMGAIEYIAGSCQGDLNDDGYVGVNDLLAVIDAWGQSDSPADLNNDGIVGVNDVLLLIAAWGQCE